MQAAQQTDPLDAERTRSIYLQLPLSLSVNLVNFLLTSFVLTTAVSVAVMVPWCVAVVILTAMRFALWDHYRRHPTRLSGHTWLLLGAVGAFLSGVLWGALAYTLFPAAPQLQLFMALVIAGMCAGAATVNASHLPTGVAFMVPATLPLAMCFLQEGELVQVISGLMIIFFVASLCLITRRFDHWFSETLNARQELICRTAELHTANQRLRDEVDRHRTTGAMLRESQKLEAIGLLTAGIAHDFNNLLTAIGGSASLMARRLPDNSPFAAQVATISDAVQRGASLTRHLLAFGRKQTLMPQTADLNAVLRDMQPLLEVTVAGQIRLALELATELPSATIDVPQLEHAILNVVVNARDATPPGGQITIRTSTETVTDTRNAGLIVPGCYAVISISDTGMGMTEAVRHRAFDPFFTTKQVGDGSGLGLSQVYGLLRQSGGAAEIDSTPASGTTVRLYIPSGSEGPTPLVATRPAPAVRRSTARPRVLLLDDEDAVRETTEELLLDAGYQVTAFATGSAALRALEAGPPVEVALVDMAMPEMSGDHFAQLAHTLRPDLRIIFITGFNRAASLPDQALVVPKPFGITQLEAAIETALAVVSVDAGSKLAYRREHPPEEHPA